MPSANKTPNYNLTQYSNNGSDKISALKDYTEDMSKIDTALNDNANNIATNATNITTKADAATTYSKTDVDSKLAGKQDKSTIDSDVSEIFSDNNSNLSREFFKKEENSFGQYFPKIAVDATGTTDVSEYFNEAIIKAIPYGGIIVPAGNYLINNPILLPDNTNNGFSFIALGAHFIANSNMDACIIIGGYHADLPNHTNVEIFGGSYDANFKANYCILDKTNQSNTKITKFTAVRAVDAYIKLGDDANAYGNSLNTLISDGKCFGTGDFDDRYTPYGILSTVSDFKLSNIDIFDARIGVNSTGFYQASMIHVYSKGRIPHPRVAFAGVGGFNLNNIYPDWCDYGAIQANVSDNGQISLDKTGRDILINEMFFYRPDSNTENSEIVPIKLYYGSSVKIYGLNYRLVQNAFQNDKFSPVVAFDLTGVQETSRFSPNWEYSTLNMYSWGNGCVCEGSNISDRGKVVSFGKASATNSLGVILGYVSPNDGFYDITLKMPLGNIYDNIKLNVGTWSYRTHSYLGNIPIAQNAAIALGAPIAVAHGNESSTLRPLYYYSTDASAKPLDGATIEVKSSQAFFATHTPWDAAPTIAVNPAEKLFDLGYSA
jgi:hypothetical protein